MKDAGFMTIDADAHIHETEDTWNWLREDELKYKPTTAFPRNSDPAKPANRYWVIDGNRRPRGFHDDARTRTTLETRELMDPLARVRQMNELGTQVQVIYPSLFLVQVSERSEIDLALKRSYNRWLAERCQLTGGRLRWVCLPPLDNMDQALEELRFAKANGACAVMKKGDREAGHWVNEEYFFPFYEECQRLDLPIVFHIGAGEFDKTSAREFLWMRFRTLGVPPLHAFYNLAMFGIPHRFPGIRWGFIEAGSSWVPFLAYDIRRRLARSSTFTPGYSYDQPSDILTKNKFYVTCQVDEDLPYIMKCATEDHLLVGSDYSHDDPAGEMDFAHRLQERCADGDISQAALRKITHDNAKAFYGL